MHIYLLSLKSFITSGPGLLASRLNNDYMVSKFLLQRIDAAQGGC